MINKKSTKVWICQILLKELKIHSDLWFLEAIILNSQDVDPSLEIVSLKSENDDSVSQRSAVEIVEKKISNENLQPAIGVIPDEHFTSSKTN